MRDRVRNPRTLGVAAALAVLAFVGLWQMTRLRAATPLGVVVITLDTTRADRLSPYGFMNVSLPALERLAEEGVVFDQATSVAPLTLPAHASLFTGLLPPRHGVRDNADSPLAESHTTLAEILRTRGFRTGAFTGSSVLGPDRGLKQGFDEYTATADRQRRGDVVVDDAIRWLDTVGDSPFLLWTHLYDPHRPYDPPEPYASLYGHNPYVGEIAFADAQIGRLLAALERKGLLDRAVIVVAGDHGESLGERGERDHGTLIYENVLRVPLIIRAPAVVPFRVGEVVRLTDIMPTILDLLGVAAPPGDGVSLASLMRGHARDLDLEAYAEARYPERFGGPAVRAVRVGRFKLIEGPRPELYDLARDPFEATNIYDERRSLAELMSGRIGAIASTASAALSADRPPVPAELRERLAALGYVTGTAGGKPRQSR